MVALGHTADDFCEAFLRNAMFTGRISALPPMTWSRKNEFRLIRPLVYVTENLTRAFAGQMCAPVIPCGCSQKTGTVRNSLRSFLTEMEGREPVFEGNAAFGDGKCGCQPVARYPFAQSGWRGRGGRRND